MGICPICNGLNSLQAYCSCGELFTDNGRVMDYYDDYSPYMPIDLLKLEDGYEQDFREQKCPHFLKCSACGQEKVVFIQE